MDFKGDHLDPKTVLGWVQSAHENGRLRWVDTRATIDPHEDKNCFERRAEHNLPTYVQGNVDACSTYLSALLDLRPRWIKDVYTGRR
jgi:hypothetical protein